MEDLREIHRRVTELEIKADTQAKSIEALYVHIDGTLERVRAVEDRVKQLQRDKEPMCSGDSKDVHERITRVTSYFENQFQRIDLIEQNQKHVSTAQASFTERLTALEKWRESRKKKPKPPTDETVKATVKMTWIVRRLRLIAQDVLDLPNGGSQSQRSIEIYEDCMSLVDNIAKDLPDI